MSKIILFFITSRLRQTTHNFDYLQKKTKEKGSKVWKTWYENKNKCYNICSEDLESLTADQLRFLVVNFSIFTL